MEKETANFCDFFRPRPNAFVSAEVDDASAAKDKLDALFGGDDEDEHAEQESDDKPLAEQDQARAELEKLFRNDDET